MCAINEMLSTFYMTVIQLLSGLRWRFDRGSPLFQKGGVAVGAPPLFYTAPNYKIAFL